MTEQQPQEETPEIYHTPTEVYDFVAGSGVFLVEIAQMIIGNPPYEAGRR